jgi:glycosyltransferase involved in cell wall biosynthesis
MRVLALTNLYPNPWQPHRATFNRDRLRILARRHEVRVIAPIAWTDEWAARRRGAAPLPAGRRVVLDGIAVEHPRYFFTPRILRGWYGRFYRFSVRRAFRRALAEFQPDVVYAPWAYPDGWAAVELGHGAGLPVVINVHGSDVCLLDQYPRRRRRTVEALCRADRVTSVSQDLARRMAALGVDPGRIEVIYDGVDPAVFHPGPQAEARARLGLPADEPMALFVGNLIALKGVELLVEAARRLASAGLRYSCQLVGQGPLRPRLEALIRSANLGQHIQLRGALPHSALPDWYRAATVFVLPSYSEGVPTVLLEAAACGTPLLATEVGGISEIASAGPCRLIRPGDVDQLTAAMKDLLTDPPRPAGGTHGFPSRAESVDHLIRLLGQVIEEYHARKDGRGLRGVGRPCPEHV